jgi:hypothetical protein
MQAVRMQRLFHPYHQMWAMTPSHRTGIVCRAWGLANTGFSIDSLADCPPTPGDRASTDF